MLQDQSRLPTHSNPAREVRAIYSADLIRVYQAYADTIADAALARGNLNVPCFSLDRMTWIKPSFLWMMCRADFGYRDPGQKRILAIDIKRSGFDWTLSNAELTAHESRSSDDIGKSRLSSDVLVQWDPERDLQCRRLEHRSIQIGLRGEAIRLYAKTWIQSITDITPTAHKIRSLVTNREMQAAAKLIPQEETYPIDSSLFHRLGIRPLGIGEYS